MVILVILGDPDQIFTTKPQKKTSVFFYQQDRNSSKVIKKDIGYK